MKTTTMNYENIKRAIETSVSEAERATATATATAEAIKAINEAIPPKATAEDINRLATAIAYKVVSSTYSQTGVKFYQELLWGAYRDKQLFEKMIDNTVIDSINQKIKNNTEAQEMYKEAVKDVKKQIKEAEKINVLATPIELYAQVLEEMTSNKILQLEYETIIDSYSNNINNERANLREAEAIKTSSTFSDFRDIAQQANLIIISIMKYNNIDYIPTDETFRRMYKFICQKVRKYIRTMSNPDTAIASKTVISKEAITEAEAQQYFTACKTTHTDGVTEEKTEIITFKDDTKKCAYSVKWYNESKQRKQGYYKVYRYTTYSKYQYITDGNINGDIKAFRVQAPFTMDFSDVEKIQHIGNKCNLSKRERMFIKCFLSACQVMTEYKKTLDYTFKKMAKLGYPIESRKDFIYNLKQKIKAVYKDNHALQEAIANEGVNTAHTTHK